MKTKLLRSSALLVSLFALLPACAADKQVAAAPATAADRPAPAVLTRSLYAKDTSGSLSEGDLQRVLAAPIDLQFPARVGVVPLAEPFDPKGEVKMTTRSVAARSLARSLVGNPNFSHVSDISTDLPNSGGIEGLRVLAARYRLRYLLLYSERFEDATHLNGWAWLYPTFVGMFIAPGVTVRSRGIAQADLLDVRTGTILYSVLQPMEVSEQEFMIGAARSHREHQYVASDRAAKELAKRVALQTNMLLAYADEASAGRHEARTRILPAPIALAPEPAKPGAETAAAK
jgi:hypothetical protein